MVSFSIPRALRIAILLLAIVATLGVAAAAASPAHFHADAPGSNCDICFTAHAVTYETGAFIEPPAAPQQQQLCFVAAPVSAGYQLFLSHAPSTRGPPFRSL